MTLKLFGNDRDIIDLKTINEAKIQEIARSLLTKYVLVVGDKEYRLAEIEFYINSDVHNDKYTHGDLNQKQFAKWYFHRYPNGSYKSGTYKGLDITMGDPDTYFGILIRSIYCAETNEFIDGPCKTVNKILELNNCSDVKEYMTDRRRPSRRGCPCRSVSDPPEEGPAHPDPIHPVEAIPDIHHTPHNLSPPPMTDRPPSPEGGSGRSPPPTSAPTCTTHSTCRPTGSLNGGIRHRQVRRQPWKRPGTPEGSNLGYGISGRRGLPLGLPALRGHGATAEHAHLVGRCGGDARLLPEHRRRVCSEYGGDPWAVLLAGFSTAPWPATTLGLHDDAIASLCPAAHHSRGAARHRRKVSRVPALNRLNRQIVSITFLRGQFSH